MVVYKLTVDYNKIKKTVKDTKTGSVSLWFEHFFCVARVLIINTEGPSLFVHGHNDTHTHTQVVSVTLIKCLIFSVIVITVITINVYNITTSITVSGRYFI